MEERNSVLQPNGRKSGLAYQAKPFRPTLLPYEVQLCSLIGISEEEYRAFTLEVIKKGQRRPAGYDHIPDIQNKVWWAWIAQIAIGAAVGYVSYLLTPKPETPKELEQRDLGSINKSGRFNPTFGFDSAQELANFGHAIPIIFTKYQPQSGNQPATGGCLVSPNLVWSRVFSHGTQQSVKLMFVVGEEGTATHGILGPELTGIFLGNNALDAVYQRSFCFYWCRKSDTSNGSRVRAVHRLYGTRGHSGTGDEDVHTGDPENGDVLLCPTDRNNLDTGFSGSYSLSNNSKFGCYEPIANGTFYRVNWRVISMINQGKLHVPAYERIKISGNGHNLHYSTPHIPEIHQTDDMYGMQGTGRNYTRRMGITYYHRRNPNSTITCPDNEVFKEINNVSVGDQCEFHIKPGTEKLRSNLYSDGRVKVDDINSIVDEMRKRADDAFQIGEIFSIGLTQWIVYHRTIDIWRPEGNEVQKIWLECIDNNGGANNTIGIVANAVLSPNISQAGGQVDGMFFYGDGFIGEGPGYRASLRNIGPTFYPLMRISKAIIKNTRPCSTTEIGIRSSVWQQINGLCNFQTIPSPPELVTADGHHDEDDEIMYNNGTVSAHIRRASAFSLQYRASTGWSDDISGWTDFNLKFVIVNGSSVDVYNWLRIRHPSVSEWEFRLVPLPGSYMRMIGEDAQLIEVSAKSGGPISKNVAAGFRIQTHGREIRRREIQRNVEFMSRPNITGATITRNIVESVSIDNVLPNPGTMNNISEISSLDYVRNRWDIGSGVSDGYGYGAFQYEIFGNADTDGHPLGHIREVTALETCDGKPVRIRYRAEKKILGDNHYSGKTHFYWIYRAITDTFTNSAWAINGSGYIPAANEWENNDWALNQEFDVIRNVQNSNPFRVRDGNTISKAGVRLKVTGINYENIIRGRHDAARYEIFGNPGSYNVGQQRTIEITMSASNSDWTINLPAGKTVRLIFESTVHRIVPHWTGRSKHWGPVTVTVNATHSDTTNTSTAQAWAANQTFQMSKTKSGANPYRASGETVGYVLKADSIRTVENTPYVFNAERVFEGESQYADLSFYGNHVRKSCDARAEHEVSYVNEIVSNNRDNGSELVPRYQNLTTAVLSFKASKNFSSIDQIRVWLKEGIKVKNLNNSDAIAPSNLFTDLVYFLLTDRTSGVGRTLGNTGSATNALIDKVGMTATGTFLTQNKLYFDGALSAPINVRQYISETAPFFLCDFTMKDGKFSLTPAIPFTSNGSINTGAIEIKQLFTSGNIIEDSFNISYLEAEEKKPFRAIVRYREERHNKLPKENSVEVRWNDGAGSDTIESFDLTAFCTSRHHAKMVGRYFLAVRRRVGHSISFRTIPYELQLSPGDYIKVSTEASPYSPANNGVIDGSGNVTSADPLADGTYSVLYYNNGTGNDGVETGNMTVSNGAVSNTSFHNSVFTLATTTSSEDVYRVEQLSLGEDGMVEIMASEFPCNQGLVSRVAYDVATDSQWIES